MPSQHAPSYRRHRPSKQAVVTLSGKDFYLGAYGSAESRAEYDRLVGEWLANGRTLPNKQQPLKVVQVMSAYLEHAHSYYRKNGKPTGEIAKPVVVGLLSSAHPSIIGTPASVRRIGADRRVLGGFGAECRGT